MTAKRKTFIVTFTGYDPKLKKDVKMVRRVRAFDTYQATDILDEKYNLRNKYVLRRFQFGGKKPTVSKRVQRIAERAGAEEE